MSHVAPGTNQLKKTLVLIQFANRQVGTNHDFKACTHNYASQYSLANYGFDLEIMPKTLKLFLQRPNEPSC